MAYSLSDLYKLMTGTGEGQASSSGPGFGGGAPYNSNGDATPNGTDLTIPGGGSADYGGNSAGSEGAPAAGWPSISSTLGGIGKSLQGGVDAMKNAQTPPLQSRAPGSPGGGMRNLTMHYPTVNAAQPFPTTAAQGATGGQAGGLDPLVLALLKAKLARGGGTGGGGLGL